MNFELLKEAIIKRAAELGVTDYEIYYESSSKSSAETLGHEISALNSSEAGGICFRCSVDGKMGYASTQLMEITEAEELVERALENGRYTEKDDNVGIFEGSPEYVRPNVNEFKALSPEELKSVALSVQKATYGADRRVVDGTQSQVESISETVRIVNSHGLDLSNSVGINVVFAEAVVEDGVLYLYVNINLFTILVLVYFNNQDLIYHVWYIVQALTLYVFAYSLVLQLMLR